MSARLALLVCVLLGAGALQVGPAAADPFANGLTLGSGSDPLKRVYISTGLQCQASRAGWTQRAFYPPSGGNPFNGACGTFLGVGPGSLVYGPKGAIPAASFSPPTTDFTPVSQVIWGIGTYIRCIETTVMAGASLRVLETDCYVSGDVSYSTSIQVTNLSSSPETIRVMHAANCNVANSTIGRGRVLPNKRVYCTRTGSPNNVSPGQAIGFIPTDSSGALLSGSGLTPVRYLEAARPTVWTRVTTPPFFNDTCTCNTNLDNGIGLSARFTLPPGSITVYGRTTF